MGAIERSGKVVNKALSRFGLGIHRIAGDTPCEEQATLEFTTVIGCPLACRCCPQGLLRSRYPQDAPRELNLDAFKSMLKTVPANVRIDFSGMAEPWTASDTTAMFQHALEQGYRVSAYSTLVGMSDEDVAFLIDHLEHFSPSNPFVLHLPDDEGVMAGFRPTAAYHARVAAVVSAMRRITSKRRGIRSELQLMTMSSRGRVHESIADLVPGELEPFEPLSRAGTVPPDQAPRVSHGYPVTCSISPGYDHNVVLPNGDVFLCCMDYALTSPIGNLLRQSYASLFESEGIDTVARANQCVGSGKSAICKSCEWAVRATEDEKP